MFFIGFHHCKPPICMNSSIFLGGNLVLIAWGSRISYTKRTSKTVAGRTILFLPLVLLSRVTSCGQSFATKYQIYAFVSFHETGHMVLCRRRLAGWPLLGIYSWVPEAVYCGIWIFNACLHINWRSWVLRISVSSSHFFCHFVSCAAVSMLNYCSLYIYLCGPGSSVGIATDYGLDGPGSNLGGDEIFRPSRPALGAHPASCKMGTGSFPGGKVRPGRGAEHSPPSSAAVMEE